MKFRKILTTIFACVLALTMLAACSKNNSGNTATNSDATEWERDIKEHWILSENGKKRKASKHDMVDNVCSDCGSEIWEYEDGSADIYNYTEDGSFLRLTSYDADGNITMDTRYEYEYDDNGHVELEKQYDFDRLVQEIEYFVTFEGESIMAKQTFYSEDGSRNINECDGNGNIITEIYCNADGVETVTAEHAYVYTPDIGYYKATSITYFEDGTKFVHDYNEYGDTVRWYIFDAFGNVTSDIRHEHTYDSEGNMISSIEYEGSWLSNEYEYALDSDGNSYCSKEIVYNEDETTTHYEYDENGEIIKEITYDYSGNVIE